jgi:hypothetical protein
VFSIGCVGVGGEICRQSDIAAIPGEPASCYSPFTYRNYFGIEPSTGTSRRRCAEVEQNGSVFFLASNSAWSTSLLQFTAILASVGTSHNLKMLVPQLFEAA